MKKEKNLPVYEIMINESELDNSGIRFISLVDVPAIQVKGLAFNSNTSCDCKEHDFANYDPGHLPDNNVRNFNIWDPNETYDAFTHPNCKCYIDDNGDWITVKEGEYPCPICLTKQKMWETRKKALNVIGALKGGRKRGTRKMESEYSEMEFATNKDKQIIAGPALIANKKIYRKDEDGEYYVVFSTDVINKMVSKFNKGNNNRSINVDHSETMVNGYVQQNWIIEDSYYDKSKMYGFNLPVGSWFVEIKIEDQSFWDNIVKGENKYSFSVEGLMGQRLIKMENEMSIEDIIDDLSDDDVDNIMNFIKQTIDEEEFFVEPKKGESDSDFMNRCVPIEIKNGHPQDQAISICSSKLSK